MIDNLEQNYESYFTSFSESQFEGENEPISDLGVCENAVTNGFMGYLKDFSGNNTLKPQDPAIPCGFIAYTMFNGKKEKMN